MKILVVNAGSSSLKFQLFGNSEDVLVRGYYDRIGTTVGPCLRQINSEMETCSVATHNDAILDMLETMEEQRAVGDIRDIVAVGHRVVHGAERYTSVTEINQSVMDELRSISYLAPLHNPINIVCIEVLAKNLPQVRQFAVFDTAFHQTIPEEIFLYGLPMELYRRHKIRKYGFHGTSHRYLSARAAEILGRPVEALKIIVCHLGNGQSVCAVNRGKSFDTSMGFTPLEGLPMGTRSGSFDPEIVLYLLREGYNRDKIRNLINKESGLLGVSGLSSDYRIIEELALAGNSDASRANKLLIKRLVSFIGSYAAEMNGVDAIVFSAGIGEHSAQLRKEVLSHFDFLGLKMDQEANAENRTIISEPSSTVVGLVIPTNEELQICREVRLAMNGSGR